MYSNLNLQHSHVIKSSPSYSPHYPIRSNELIINALDKTIKNAKNVNDLCNYLKTNEDSLNEKKINSFLAIGFESQIHL